MARRRKRSRARTTRLTSVEQSFLEPAGRLQKRTVQKFVAKTPRTQQDDDLRHGTEAFHRREFDRATRFFAHYLQSLPGLLIPLNGRNPDVSDPKDAQLPDPASIDASKHSSQSQQENLRDSDASSSGLGRSDVPTDGTMSSKARVSTEFILRKPSIDELRLRYRLISCRLSGDNTETELKTAVFELAELILFVPHDLSLKISKCDAHVRLFDFGAAAATLLETLEINQSSGLRKEIISFLESLIDATSPEITGIPYPVCKSHSISKPETITRSFTHTVPVEELRSFFSSQLRTTRKSYLTARLSEIHRAIDSSMFVEVTGHECGHCRKLLHQTLDFNINKSQESMNLFFIGQELACQIAYRIWNEIQITVSKTTATNDGKASAPRSLSQLFFNNSDESLSNPKNPSDPLKASQASFFNSPESFFVRDGIDFIGSTGMESLEHISNAFRVQHHTHPDPSISMSLNYLSTLGFDFVELFSTITSSTSSVKHICSRFCCQTNVDELKQDVSMNDEPDWQRFIQSRLHAHEILEVKGQSYFAPQGASNLGEKALKFEETLSEVLGPEVQHMLTVKEIEFSVPVLLDYSRLMNRISGIPTRFLLLELFDRESADKYGITLLDEILSELPSPTEKDCEDHNHKRDFFERCVGTNTLLNDQNQEYVPIGLALLIQNHEFYVSEECYDSEKIAEDLKRVEKSVVRMQLDYRALVQSVAKEKYQDLEEVMTTLQQRGLELTKWLRGFVRYMMDRRLVLHDIIEQSGAGEFCPEAMEWFDTMQSRLSVSQNYLIAIISRIFLGKIEAARTCFEDSQVQPTESSPLPIIGNAARNALPNAARGALPSIRVTNPDRTSHLSRNRVRLLHSVSARYEETKKPALAQKIVEFITSCFQKLQREKIAMNVPVPTAAEIATILRNHILHSPQLKEKRSALLKRLAVSQLLISFVSIPVPAQIISSYTGWTARVPHANPMSVHAVYSSPLSQLVALLERWKFSEEVICFFVHSSVDQTLMAFPSFTGLGTTYPDSKSSMYPLCAACNKDYGIIVCQRCEVARYCGEICQSEHNASHSKNCKVWSQHLKKNQVFAV